MGLTKDADTKLQGALYPSGAAWRVVGLITTLIEFISDGWDVVIKG